MKAEKKKICVELEIDEIEEKGLVEFQLIEGKRLMISSEELKDEIAPLVSAFSYKNEEGKGCLRLRIVVFVGNTSEMPKIGVTNNYSCFYVQADNPDNQIPTYYKIYYFHFDIVTDYIVNQITVFNNQADPKTSRGTVTTVQSTTPPTKEIHHHLGISK